MVMCTFTVECGIERKDPTFAGRKSASGRSPQPTCVNVHVRDGILLIKLYNVGLV